MSCDALIVRGKIAQVAEHIIAKECLTEEVIDDITSCNICTSQIWYGLHEAVSKMSSCKLKGRIRSCGKGQYCVAIPVVKEFATMISDFMGTVESQCDDNFFPPPEDGKTAALITPVDISHDRHVYITGRTEGDVSISLGDIMFQDHKILFQIDILDEDVIPLNTHVVMAEFTWI